MTERPTGTNTDGKTGRSDRHIRRAPRPTFHRGIQGDRAVADAEDVLQENWLRWVKVDLEQVRERRVLGANRHEASTQSAADAATNAELAESLSMALMLVLETLSPTARAVFVLKEAFDLSYDEIAAAVDKSPAADRQIAHRARRHVDHARRCLRGMRRRYWRRSNVRSRPLSCKISLTFSRRTSCF